ncbi:hypothetical protein Zm00014a_042210 [Zea mays]|uniref:Uncharacterized protein n=2 Tax=Zea mays TaxID=4577 RepID=A0A3L6DZA7_MAIZE|nr:hypothetical protein Zm00014a_042210 [Zea mays]
MSRLISQSWLLLHLSQMVLQCRQLMDLRTGEVIGTGRRRRAAPRLYILDSLRLPSLATSPAHSVHAEMGSISDAERELQLVEEKIHDAEQHCKLQLMVFVDVTKVRLQTLDGSSSLQN